MPPIKVIQTPKPPVANATAMGILLAKSIGSVAADWRSGFSGNTNGAVTVLGAPLATLTALNASKSYEIVAFVLADVTTGAANTVSFGVRIAGTGTTNPDNFAQDGTMKTSVLGTATQQTLIAGHIRAIVSGSTSRNVQVIWSTSNATNVTVANIRLFAFCQALG